MSEVDGRTFWDRTLLEADASGRYDISYRLGSDTGTLFGFDGFFGSSGTATAVRRL